MKKLLALAVFLTLLGCSRPDPSSGNPKGKTPEPIGKVAETPKQLPPPEIEVPRDRSLSVKEYMQAGFPDPEGPWGLTEMFKARTALRTLAKDPAHFPRYESKRSGAVFARLTSAQNLDRYRDKNLPLRERLDVATSYLVNFTTIHELYTQAMVQQAVGDSEMVEIAGFYLELAVWWKSLVDESLQGAKDDPDRKRQDESADQARKGWGTMIAIAADAVASKELYRASERLRLLATMKKTVPSLYTALPADARKDLRQRLQKMSQDPDQKALHAELAALNTLILNAIEAENP
jgi:hypothetical protein